MNRGAAPGNTDELSPVLGLGVQSTKNIVSAKNTKNTTIHMTKTPSQNLDLMQSKAMGPLKSNEELSKKRAEEIHTGFGAIHFRLRSRAPMRNSDTVQTGGRHSLGFLKQTFASMVNSNPFDRKMKLIFVEPGSQDHYLLLRQSKSPSPKNSSIMLQVD
ncbi:hypothetical protein AKJ16_DCAP20481 [Drosera capensis]